MSWDKWQAQLRGDKVMNHPQPDDTNEGFYRIPVREKHATNGTNKIVGWTPICYFMYEGELVGNIGEAGQNRDMTANEVTDKWTWCCNHPITEDQYRAVAERGEPWHDLVKPEAAAPAIKLKDALNVSLEKIASGDLAPAANRTVRLSDNQPEAPAEVIPPEVEHATAIDTAIAAATFTVTSDAEAARALGSKNRIAELRLAADKTGKAIYEPIYRDYKRVRSLWSPIISRATDAENKLNVAVLTFRESERRRIAAEQLAAAQKLKEQEAANARNADRAIAAGKPEPAPVVTETVVIPASPAPLAPTYGTRKLKEEVKFILDQVTSYDLLFQHYKGNAEVQALLTKLATADIKAGRTVPGTTTREGLI